MNKHPTLYSRDSHGNIREWYMEVDGNRYRTVSGIQGGEMVQSVWRDAHAMNEGRSNATTPEEQAVSEVESSYAKKLRMKYHEDVANVDKDKYFKPMLAHDYTKRYTLKKKSVEFPVEAQPKLDGIRCIVTSEGAWSRTGKPILAIPHILEALAPSFRNNPELVLDGELYNHELRDDFNTITSLVRKIDPDYEEIAKSVELIQYHIYDCPSVDGEFRKRIAGAVAATQHYPHPSIRIVETLFANDQDTLDAYYARWMEQGYEGQIIRLPADYEHKRSNSLIKRKEFIDDEFEIVAIEEGRGNWAGHAKRVICKLSDGRNFGTGLRGNKEYAKKILKEADEYIGKQVTVRFQNYTPDDVPRFGVCHVLHKEERW